MSDRGLNKEYWKSRCEAFEERESELYALMHRLRSYWGPDDFEATRDMHTRQIMSSEMSAYENAADWLEEILEKGS